VRHLGIVEDEKSARHFADYLLTKGIAVSVEIDGDSCRLWAQDEDHLEDARREFAEFLAAPEAPLYRESVPTAAELRRLERKRSRQARKNFVDARTRWGAPSPSRQPVTFLLLAVSIGVTLFSNFGSADSITAALFMDRYNSVPYLWGFFKTEHVQGEDLPKKLMKGQFMPDGGAFPLEHAWRTEPWRLVTPIFLHFSVIHLLFNMMTLWQFGPPIESSRGSWRFALLVVAIAIASNVAQYLWSGPAFGGMSGVLYGLFGYLWMQSRYEWTSEFYVSRNMVIWMIGWSVMCVSGILGPIGNACHFAGLFVGMIIGRWPSYWRSLRRPAWRGR
jgi:GlpG protein